MYKEHETLKKTQVVLDGDSMSPHILVALGRQTNVTISLSHDAWEQVKNARDIIDGIVASNKIVYGVNTGFGNFATVVIPKTKLEELQLNLIRSHAAGVGKPLSVQHTRMLLALRINTLAKGYSGISRATLQQVVNMFNAGLIPQIPCKGTVGASGDLAPLAHLALGMLGEGMACSVGDPQWRPANDVLQELRLAPLRLMAKEGLALINGTQMICALGCDAVVSGHGLARQADIVAALSLEALKGTVRAFHPSIHAVRAHTGQGLVAGRVRHVLHNNVYPSEIAISHKECDKVQDAYTLRCTAQVHGVVNDTIRFVYEILRTECNSATDNPMVFPELKANNSVLSGGNFHGEYPAKALDYFGIGIHEIGSISERRIERLLNPSLSGLPAFLVPVGGLNSGFMIAHCTAAALVSENKVLCHPASIDSISLSAAKEDHVSMGGHAARKALKIVDHVETIVAIELLCAVQAVEFHRPLKTTEALERVIALVREQVPRWETDRVMAPDIEKVKRLLKEEKVWKAAREYIPTKLHHIQSDIKGPTMSHL